MVRFGELWACKCETVNRHRRIAPWIRIRDLESIGSIAFYMGGERNRPSPVIEQLGDLYDESAVFAATPVNWIRAGIPLLVMAVPAKRKWLMVSCCPRRLA